MGEIVLALLASGLMAKIAEMEGLSGRLWGLLTFVLCSAAGFIIPFPFVGVPVGGVLGFGGMIAVKALSK